MAPRRKPALKSRLKRRRIALRRNFGPKRVAQLKSTSNEVGVNVAYMWRGEYVIHSQPIGQSNKDRSDGKGKAEREEVTLLCHFGPKRVDRPTTASMRSLPSAGITSSFPGRL